MRYSLKSEYVYINIVWTKPVPVKAPKSSQCTPVNTQTWTSGNDFIIILKSVSQSDYKEQTFFK